MPSERVASVDEIIEEAKNGRMFILVDDEDRENEGDLIIPAQMATPQAINFMARYGRGLICLAMTKSRVEKLGIPMMTRVNGTRHETAFTVSIEAKEGVTTGISANDRARTIAVAIDASRGEEDIVTPGHVFPLVARDGGVLIRAGHTEAAVDVARLAGLNPSGVICEIMNDDGTMARMDDLRAFARIHELKIGTIRDLIAYRRRHDHLVECVSDEPFSSDFGGLWRLRTYRNKVDGGRSFALIKGAVDPASPTLVRVHSASIFNDMLGQSGPKRNVLALAMAQIAAAGAGVIVLLFPPCAEGGPNVSSGELADPDMDQRGYGTGAQILADLDIHEMVLLTNSPHRTIVGLKGFGISIVGEKPLTGAASATSAIQVPEAPPSAFFDAISIAE